VKGQFDSWMVEMLDTVNTERAKRNKAALCYNEKLIKAAEVHAKDMSNNDFLSHTGSDGSSMGDRIKAQNYKYNSAGENVAWGYSSVSSVMNGWMNSEGHKANILSENFAHFGAAWRQSTNHWVQVFGNSNTEDCDSVEDNPTDSPTENPTKSPNSVEETVSPTKNPTKSPTPADPNGYEQWRIWSNSDFADKNSRWSVAEVEFFSDVDCSTEITEGVPIESGHHQNNGPDNAFDGSETTRWAGKWEGGTEEFWLGLNFSSAKEVRCVSVLDFTGSGVSRVEVQRLASNNLWETVAYTENHVSGELQMIKILNPATSSPTKSPTNSPTSSPTKSPMKSITEAPTKAPSPSNSNGYSKWRLWSKKGKTQKEDRWAVADLKFYSDFECEGEIFNEGTPIESGHHQQNNGPDNAFDDSETTRWAGKWEAGSEEFWLGLQFSSAKEVRCVSLLDIDGTGALEVKVQAFDTDSEKWLEMVQSESNPGERIDITIPNTNECLPGETQLLIKIKADKKSGKENKFTVLKQNSKGKFKKLFDPVQLVKKQLLEASMCISEDSCHRFSLKDSEGTGICCDKGEGYYELALDGEVFEWSRFENGYERYADFGDC